MKKSMLYICILSIMVLLVACKNKNTTSINTTSATTELATTVVGEETTARKDVYLGMTWKEFWNMELSYAQDYRVRIGRTVSFLDGDEGVILTFDEDKVIDIKRFKEPIKRAKAADLKRNISIYEAIETVGVKNILTFSVINTQVDIYVVLDEEVTENSTNLYKSGVDIHDVYTGEYVCTFIMSDDFSKVFYASNEELNNECNENGATITAMDVGKMSEAKNYEEVVAIIGKPQRRIEDKGSGLGWTSVDLEWDIAGGKSSLVIKFDNTFERYIEGWNIDMGDMKVMNWGFKDINGNIDWRRDW